MAWSELEKLLKSKTNCRHTGERSGHAEWMNFDTGQLFTMERHKSHEVPKGTLHQILKIAGLK